jgi:hypothetical protein
MSVGTARRLCSITYPVAGLLILGEIDHADGFGIACPDAVTAKPATTGLRNLNNSVNSLRSGALTVQLRSSVSRRR